MVKTTSFAQIWSLDGGKGWKRAYTEKGNYLNSFRQYSDLTIVDYFVCLRICVDLLCDLIFNEYISFAIEKNYIVCDASFTRSLCLYLWEQNLFLADLRKTKRLDLHLIELLTFNSWLQRKSASSRLHWKSARGQSCI